MESKHWKKGLTEIPMFGNRSGSLDFPRGEGELKWRGGHLSRVMLGLLTGILGKGIIHERTLQFRKARRTLPIVIAWRVQQIVDMLRYGLEGHDRTSIER